MSRYKIQGEINQRSLPGFLEDDPNLERTKEYTWVLAILRRLRNLLAKLVATWNAFEMNHSIYFDLDKSGILYDNFRQRFYHIQGRMAELQALHMVMEQRIETLEKLSSTVSTSHWSFVACVTELTTCSLLMPPLLRRA